MVTIEVSPNIELISVVLSYTSWVDTFGISPGINYSYRDDINTWFDGEKLHSAIIQASNLVFTGFSFDAPLNFILHFGAPPNLTLKYNYSNYILLRGGGEPKLNAFIQELRDFATITNFTDFFTAHKSFYNSIISDFTAAHNWTDAIITLETFMGLSKSNYTIILTPFMFTGGGFGASIGDEDNTHLYSIIRTGKIQNNTPYFGSPISMFNIILHEFAHGFIDPIVEAHMDQFEQYSDLYWTTEGDYPLRGIYTSWQAMLQETLIRAFTSWAISIEYSGEKADEWLGFEEQQGFYFIRDIYDSYFEFMDKRDQYSTFDHFIPKILKVLDRVLSQVKGNTRETSTMTFIEIIIILSLLSLFYPKKNRLH